MPTGEAQRAISQRENERMAVQREAKQARGQRQMTTDDRLMWRLTDGTRAIECVMISCCAGAELQIRRVRLSAPSVNEEKADTTHIDDEIVLRELYPTKSDLYERARALEAEYLASGARHDDQRRNR